MNKKIKYAKVNFIYFDSPLGLIEIQSQMDKIIGLGFVNERKYEEKMNNLLVEAKRQIREYFNGERNKFNLPIEINGTDFQKKVWKELMNIPYGKVLSYGNIAKNIGNEKASRAVGNANNKNKIAIIIPCHRVIGSNGKLVGYEGGLWRKRWLLDHEGNYLNNV
ncbi:methylated-DNA--[protein]-cysteine S-methyltransferase [Dethiothermospora halolimnae]|uniref:methylated-DNA--[protein]-cysteine S-methyltransferase n=1 Tax=Dethiothermospora halolimnae TaxID=3114390 RepID=UPI003CCC0F6C